MRRRDSRCYDPRLSLWISTDIEEERYPYFTSYCYTINNPIKYVDIYGNAPIYSIHGVFGCTDDEGLSGTYIIMDKKYFVQGMAHSQAQKYLYSGNIAPETTHRKIWKHNAELVKL